MAVTDITMEVQELRKLRDDILEIIKSVETYVPKEKTLTQGRSQDFNDGYHHAIYGIKLLIHASKIIEFEEEK